mgnify:CR=1 FL=1
MKYATTLDEQVDKLKNRGLVINDEEKAKEVLLDIGYYRFGAYLFPFEKKYPSKKSRDHLQISMMHWTYTISTVTSGDY